MGEEEEEKEVKWFSRWEEELPMPEELMPLSQTLITPDLAVAFDIPTINNTNTTPPPPLRNVDETSMKKPRLVWTPQLHKRFVEAVAHLGIKNAVPKTIMQLMNVDGLTRENVASHLQKYRLYLKRMQQHHHHSSASTNSSSSSPFVVVGDSDRLFATAPVPAQFLRAPYAPVAAMQQHYRHVPMMMTAPPGPGGMHRMAVFRPPQPPSYAGESEAGKRMAGRRVLSLFPDGED